MFKIIKQILNSIVDYSAKYRTKCRHRNVKRHVITERTRTDRTESQSARGAGPPDGNILHSDKRGRPDGDQTPDVCGAARDSGEFPGGGHSCLPRVRLA